ncbi:MAG: hypothetical protein ACO1RX_10145 [Candidatus Sericytochromatia bacterium]
MISLPQLSQLVFHYYDHNRDGVLQLNKGVGYEAERVVRSQTQSSYQHDTVTISWVSHAKLLGSADHDRDMRVTQAEVQALLNSFDSNRDQTLDQFELARFQQAYPEQRGVIEQQQIARVEQAPPYLYPWALGTGSAGVSLPSRN